MQVLIPKECLYKKNQMSLGGSLSYIIPITHFLAQ